MPHQTEPSANNALGNLLQAMLPRSEVRSENTGMIAGHPGLRPDILITAPGSAPVVIEAEYMPAAHAEEEARQRLGLETTVFGRPIEAAVALRYPSEVGESHDLNAALSDARLSYCVFTENGGVDRFPESGWLDGSVEDLADMVRLVSVPQHAVDSATTTLQEGIDAAAKFLDEIDRTRPGITNGIAGLLGMANVRQTRRMACAIIANALVFHDQIAGMHARIKSLAMACGDSVANPQGEVLEAWDAILRINYWPIFAIAKDILEHLDSADAARILRRLRNTAQAVNASGVGNAHDLTGRIFQRLIADRKYLATFYTLPASAALLARLAVSKLEGVDWSDAKAIGKLRIGDFACGTGALLSAVYEQIAARHERAGGNASKLHQVMMEEVLYGCDVMPSAIHITGSTLSGVEPAVGFNNSRLYTMPYGRQKDGSVMIGSLELLQSSNVMTLFNTSDPAMRTGSAGEETAAQISTEIRDLSYDLVIMNPPFTSATNHEGAHADITNPAFAAFNATHADQTAMGQRANALAKNTCYHGNAGIASAFAALAHKKLKLGGVVALVLPLSATAGLSWQGLREMLSDHYTELTVVTIAAADNDDLSFSSDTGMAECLIVARRLKVDEPPDEATCFISLSYSPQDFAHANALAQKAIGNDEVRRIQDGPYGASPLTIGEELAGKMIKAPRDQDGASWGAVRLSDYSTAQTAYALSRSKLWLPGIPAPVELKAASLAEVGKLGFVHRDITGPAPRGPFDKEPPSPTATYPALWNHDAKSETQMVCVPDSQLRVRSGMENKAALIWATASRAHQNLDFRFNSQPLTVAFTEQVSIGGTAWPNVLFDDRQFDYAFAVWGNSTLGLLCFWWRSNRQMAGRGRITIRGAETLPVLDLRCLTDEQLLMAEMIFDEFRDKDLLPAYLADADPNRALLDRRVICDLLAFDEEIYQASADSPPNGAPSRRCMEAKGGQQVLSWWCEFVGATCWPLFWSSTGSVNRSIVHLSLWSSFSAPLHSVGERIILHQRGVGVDHGRGDVFIVVVKPVNETLNVLMDRRLTNEFFGGRASHHNKSVAIVVVFELPDVAPYRFHRRELAACDLGVGALDASHVIVVEDRRHGLYRLQEMGDGVQLFVAVQDTGLDGRVVGVVGDRVPCAEDQLVESRQRNEVAYQRRPPVRSLAEANGCHLGDRACRLSRALPDMLDASDKCGRHGAQAHLKNPQSAACRADRGNVGRDKSRASKLTPRRCASPNSRSCHWDGIRPVLAQCCTVL